MWVIFLFYFRVIYEVLVNFCSLGCFSLHLVSYRHFLELKLGLNSSYESTETVDLGNNERVIRRRSLVSKVKLAIEKSLFR